MEIYAPDTNFFLQCHLPDQLDWKLLTCEEEVVLLVVREVRKELDRLKSGGNLRRSRRARAASAILRRLTGEGLQEIDVRASGPHVVLRVASRAPIEALPSGYRIESADERIVAEVFAAKDSTKERITFLSHDTVPIEDAMVLGLETQVIPDAWLLEPEPSAIERELNEVKRRMKALEGRSPSITLEVPTDADGRVRLESPYFPPLSAEFIAAAMRGVRAKHAITSDGDALSRIGRALSALEEVDETRWARYAKDHAEWLEQVEFALQDAGRHMNEDPHGVKLSIGITNTGSAGAENLIIRIDAKGDFHLVDTDTLEEPDDSFKYFPVPPRRPRSRLVESLQGIGAESYNFSQHIDRMNFPVAHIARDRHSLYWEYGGDGYSKCVEGQCQDFRHGLRADELVLSLERDAVGDEPIQGALEVLVSAGNLAELGRVVYPVYIEPKYVDTEVLVRDLLKRELSVKV